MSHLKVALFFCKNNAVEIAEIAENAADTMGWRLFRCKGLKINTSKPFKNPAVSKINLKI